MRERAREREKARERDGERDGGGGGIIDLGYKGKVFMLSKEKERKTVIRK